MTDLRDPRMEPREGDVVEAGVHRRVTRTWTDEHGTARVAWDIPGSEVAGMAGASSLTQWRRWARPTPPETLDIFEGTP